MKIEIKSCVTGSVLFEGDFSCIADAVAAAVKARADLRSANLRYANLRSADLRSANLRYANLRSANLRSADLQSANLQYANLRYANLRYANLRSADLRSANLRSANLRSADLRSADLRSADLRSAKNASLGVAQTRILPDGDLTGWKKLAGGIVAKLRIPEHAKRSHAFGRKCRASEAIVLGLFKDNGELDPAVIAISTHDVNFGYRKGDTVKPTKPFSEDWTQECAPGIHFFITREEAEAYDA